MEREGPEGLEGLEGRIGGWEMGRMEREGWVMLAHLEFPCPWIDSGIASTTTSGHAYLGVKQPGKWMGVALVALVAHFAIVREDSYSFAATGGSGDDENDGGGGDYLALSPWMGAPRSSSCLSCRCCGFRTERE